MPGINISVNGRECSLKETRNTAAGRSRNAFRENASPSGVIMKTAAAAAIC